MFDEQEDGNIQISKIVWKDNFEASGRVALWRNTDHVDIYLFSLWGKVWFYICMQDHQIKKILHFYYFYGLYLNLLFLFPSLLGHPSESWVLIWGEEKLLFSLSNYQVVFWTQVGYWKWMFIEYPPRSRHWAWGWGYYSDKQWWTQLLLFWSLSLREWSGRK